MKPNKNGWIFYLIAGGAVVVNEIATNFGVHACTFVPLALIVFWAGLKFLSKEESGS